MRLFQSMALAVVFALSSPAARADIAPDPGFEERCNIETFQKAGDECVICRTSQENPDACAKEHAQGGWARQCQRGGGSEWTEIWCRVKPRALPPSSGSAEPDAPPEAGEAPAQAPPPSSPDKKAGACGACELGADGRTPLRPGSALVLMMALMVRRRMR